MLRFLFCWFLFLLCAVPTVNAETEAEDAGQCEDAPSVKISVTNSGLYRIPGSTLRDVFACAPFSLDDLRLSNFGTSTPFGLLHGTQTATRDLIFVAHHLAGAHSYYDEFSEYNTYWLTMGEPATGLLTPSLQGTRNTSPSALFSWAHLEMDELRVRFRGRADAPQPEVWYWARLNSIDSKPFVVSLDLKDRHVDAAPAIRIGLRGWSTPPRQKFPDMADHRVEVFLNEQLIGSGEWQGQDEYIVEIPEIPAGLLQAGSDNQLSLRVPERTAPNATSPLVDAVLLNWVELDYQKQGSLAVGQHYLRVAYQEGGWFQLSGAGETPPVLMSEQGQLLEPFNSYQRGKQYWHRYLTLKDVSAYVAVVGDAFHQPAAIVTDTPSNLRDTEQQADYLMLTHRSLRQAVEPLADFHRQRGLNVQLIDIEDVYDEFNHGVLAPSAIRDFISHAYHNWQSPRPRFVLLVGDASWDVRSDVGRDRNYADWTFRRHEKTRFVKNSSSKYSDNLNTVDRNLIPTWPVDTYEGYAASDNVFVAIDGDDYLPDLAIGRFPVSDPADVAAIVNKTINYHQQTEVGPWRRNVLWITNEQLGLQRTSDQLEHALAENGFTGAKIYPSKQEKDNVEHQSKLLNAFNDGQLLVHFIGHGGRYVWRTGPPDIRKNHDLFTLDHLEQLSPTNRLPFVMSMTCYSAPFDHPTADSIGEKFLRMPDRGAIGVLAASWRNTPGLNFSQAVLSELSQPGTMGEAVMHAKQTQTSRLMIETYNLLGDPAARLALPGHKIKLDTKQKRNYLQIKGRVIDASFNGQVIIEWQDINGTQIDSEQLTLKRGKFKLKIDNNPEHEIANVSVYAWNPEQGIDAMGGVAFEVEQIISKAP